MYFNLGGESKRSHWCQLISWLLLMLQNLFLFCCSRIDSFLLRDERRKSLFLWTEIRSKDKTKTSCLVLRHHVGGRIKISMFLIKAWRATRFVVSRFQRFSGQISPEPLLRNYTFEELVRNLDSYERGFDRISSRIKISCKEKEVSFI